MATKHIKFLSFPPVLHVHLKRFSSKVDSASYSKVNDILEYPEILNLGISLFFFSHILTFVLEKFLRHKPSHDSVCKFHLMGVIVHSGKGVGHGHYYTFLNPYLEGDWFCFDDELVTRVWFLIQIKKNQIILKEFNLILNRSRKKMQLMITLVV